MMTILVITFAALIVVTILALRWRAQRDPMWGQRGLDEYFSSIDEDWNDIMDDYR